MFDITLTKQLVKVTHINLREEKHGKEFVPAIDITIGFDTPNDYLTYLSPTLKWSLYDKPVNVTEDMLDPKHLPTLRYPEMGEIHWQGELTGAVVYFHGEKKSEDLELAGKVNKLRLTCKDGGTVSASLRVQVLPTPAQAGRAVQLLGKEIKVSITRTDEDDHGGGDGKKED